MPLRRQVLHARHDGHGAQHRHERRDRQGNGRADRQLQVRLRLVPPSGADVRIGRDERLQGALREGPGGLSPQARRRQRFRPAGGRPAGNHCAVQADYQGRHGQRLPVRSLQAAPAGHRGRLQELERQARLRLPQRLQDRPRPGHRGQHRDHGLRQHGPGQRHRRAHHPQRLRRHPGDRGRLPDQRPGRGRGLRHPPDHAHGRHEGGHAGDVRRAGGYLSPVGEVLPRDPGHRVHGRARQAVDAADPQRQAHRSGRHPHRRGHGRRGLDLQDRGRPARFARSRGLLPAPAVRRRGQEGCHGWRRADRHWPERVARRGGRPDRLRRRHG